MISGVEELCEKMTHEDEPTLVEVEERLCICVVLESSFQGKMEEVVIKGIQ
mgnify:CR=1 FL=1